MADTFGPGYDWRGTKIEPGQHVIYGAPVGRSIAMVEGEVVDFTKSGRVNIRITRRAYGQWRDSKPIVHVGADRLTVLNPGALPPTTLPTQDEHKTEQERAAAEREAHYNTHDLKPRPQQPDYTDPIYHTTAPFAGRSMTIRTHAGSLQYRTDYATYDQALHAWSQNPCNRCTATNRELSHQDCTVSA